jgi:hypothetical protein
MEKRDHEIKHVCKKNKASVKEQTKFKHGIKL